jgi:hypothetical protein
MANESPGNPAPGSKPSHPGGHPRTPLERPVRWAGRKDKRLVNIAADDTAYPAIPYTECNFASRHGIGSALNANAGTHPTRVRIGWVLAGVAGGREAAEVACVKPRAAGRRILGSV